MSPPVSESPILAAEVSGPLAPTPMGSPAPVLTTLAYRKNQTISTPSHTEAMLEPPAPHKGLVLHSPIVGVAAAVYPWPLKKGKGSMRRSEDKQDEGAEIVDTIRWVCVDHPCIEDAMQDSDYYTKYDSKSFENMTAICNRYNKAVDQYHRKLTESQGTAKVNNHFSSSSSNNASSKISNPSSNHLSRRGSNSSSGSSSSSSSSSSSENSLLLSSKRNGDLVYPEDQLTNGQELTRVSRPLLKHILTKCYNKSVTDPNELNHYEAFTPEVYGETSFELICQILDKLTPISSDNKFVDLGSGVGQVVLQVAALTTCSFSLGIEKANTPARYAKEMETNFRYWMSFYGKIYSPFKLVHGDFLDAVHRPGILASTIVFVNNFAFGPEVDQHLKDIFADLNDGARIFSSKSFCALNFRITERNLSDIGTIMHVSKMDPLKGSVSWTGKPVSYYLHVIDRAKLERYFQRNAASRKTDKDEEGGGRRGRKRRDRGDGILPAALLREENGMDSSDSRDVSRASSVERDENSNPSGLRRAISDSNDGSTPSHRRPPALKRMGSHPMQHHRRGGGLPPLDDLDSMDSSSSMLPPAPAGTPASGLSTQPVSEGEGDDAMIGGGGGVPAAGAHRPLRSTVANAAAITEALAGKKKKGRPRKVPLDLAEYAEKNDKLANSISGLDLLHDTTLRCIQESNENDDAPLGCVNERLSEIAPQGVIEHEELPQTLRLMPDGSKIPHQLQLFLETMKTQYLTFMQTMQEEAFKTKVQGQIQDEQKRQGELHKREKQLKAQIDNLISDSLGLLQCRLQELGIKAKTPPEFIEKAKGIVCSHHDLQKNKASLEAEVRALEANHEKLMLTKERELLEKLAQERPDLSATSAKEVVRRELEVQSRPPRETRHSHEPSPTPTKVAPLLNKLSDVTFTKCGGEQVSAQIRKRPQKQRDWPEKRSKLSAAASPPPSSPTAWVPTSSSIVAKIEEKSPEMLARKIIDEGRTLEKQPAHQRPSSAATLTISPTKANRSFHRDTFPPHHSVGASGASGTTGARSHHPPGMVEVRKIEPMSPPSYPTMAVGSAVDLPKIDLAASMAASSASHHHNHAHHPLHHQPHGHASVHPEGLLLPPHPDSRSRSRSSEHTLDGGDVSFAKSKMSTTPRAEQFEDRLKTIIHSVLSSDQQGGGPPPAMTITSTAPSSSYPSGGSAAGGAVPGSGVVPRQAPMFSPVKRELPSHLPPPPNTRHPASSAQVSHAQSLSLSHAHSHAGGGPARALQYPSYHPSAPRVSEKHGQGGGPLMPRHHLPPMKRPPSREYNHHGGQQQQQQQQQQQPPPTSSSSSSRTMNDLISSEIDRSLLAGPPPPPPSSTPSSLPSSRRGSFASHTPSPGAPTAESASNLSRTMSQVIEDSIRGHLSGNRRVGGELEGLALPRTKSPEPASSSSGSLGAPPRAHYPTTTDPSSSAPSGFDQTRSGPVATSSSAPSSGSLSGTTRNGGNDYPAMEGLAARFGTYMAAENKRMMDPRGRYMSSMEHQQQGGHERPSSSGGRGMLVSSSPMASSSTSLGLDRKRLSSPPVLPPKKQHLDDNPDYRLPKDENKQQWQDEISTGFDRLVAYATEVDRRRKSTDSNSPSHPTASSSSSPKYNNNNNHQHHHNHNNTSNSHASQPPLSHPTAGSLSSSASLPTLSSSRHHQASGFDHRMSTLSMKFKGSYRRCAVTPPPPNGNETGSTPRIPTPGSCSSRAATPSSTSGHAQLSHRGKSPLPGENLPEHHPKKRYFAETRDSTSASSSASSTYGGAGMVPVGSTKPRLLNPIKAEPYSSGYERHTRPGAGGPTPPTGSGPASQPFYETPPSVDPTRTRPTMR
ncbi:histone-lysine N-methyltransferase, H3 lysine-79 specific-like [Tigriopus californicus]|uniref:histone-lysine N-methyltransferase, H3 lysine-79 specific-like n=1 Tax=Tigriopus californicus TaxID=6832 RepID=UPI0027DA9C18|nr:histone-lysine N-methyltransferase, H3 lysine-79 specific-like [Tigriopus californicus]